MKTKKQKKNILDIRLTLILFAMLPMIFTAVILSVTAVSNSSKELKSSAHNSLVAIIDQVGTAFDNATIESEATMKGFIESPIVRECLKNPGNAELQAKAQEYTTNFFATLDGWEGIYIADWNSQVITHPAPPVVGKVMREGDRLKELQDAMLASDGVFNVGIIISPASGQLIMSMYAPVYDENNNPIGYVGAGTFVNDIAAKYADVSGLDLSTAYIYYVGAGGEMLYHPDESKIGNPVENEAVKKMLAKIEAGEHPATECVEYLYKGKMKYAACYTGMDEAYVAVLTADESEVLSSISEVTLVTVIIGIVCAIIFTILSILIARLVSTPLAAVAKATAKLGSGDVTVECNAKSHIKEILGIIDAFGDLKNALSSSMTNVKESARVLSTAILSVDGKTSDNVESISQINNAISEVASTSQAVAEEAQNMAEKAVELGQEIEVLGTNVNELYDGAVVIRNANNEATNCMKSVYEGSKQSVEAVESISTRIKDTNDAVEKISSAIEAIEAIAAQTNLLSLNASIEAARAGEAGRGFAIVAQEIRSLADSSADSAQEIKQIVEEVVHLSNDTVKISDKVREVISTQQSDIADAQEKFAKLSETVEASVSGINVIKEIASTMDGIKVDFSNSTTELGAISEELGAAAEEVAASCQTVTDACTDTQASTEEMRAINENMATAIDYFELG